jgi:capsular exopolysaccharide synthesis family protein
MPKRLQRQMLLFAESVDGLRTALALADHIGSSGAHKILAVSSAASGEGKTCVATSLAMSIAGASKAPTLVVDADMRSPDVAAVLNVPAQPGLADVLTGKCALSEAIHQVRNSNAFVLPAGRVKSSPHQILQPLVLKKLMETLRHKFETVIIDTPPVLSASESLVCARAADGVLFCSLQEVSRTKQIRVALERLENAQANVLGAVLSGTSPKSYSYDYGHYLQPIALRDA